MKLGMENQFAVNPSIQITSDSARSRFSPDDRGCYFEVFTYYAMVKTMRNLAPFKQGSTIIRFRRALSLKYINNTSGRGQPSIFVR